MTRLTVSLDGSHLRRDGSPFPFIVDTAWSAFADASEAEWVHYLHKRRQQGFTSIAVSILPILHDRTVREGAREPFVVDDESHFDFSAPDAGYFATASHYADLASECGMTLTLVVLWCNYVQGTWGSTITPWAVIPRQQRQAYVSLVTSTFGPFDPVFVISGDERFDDPRAAETYQEVLAQVAAEAPHCLVTTHTTPDAQLPEKIANSPDLDFFVYQSGHDMERQDLCFDLAQLYRGRAARKPVVNLEPAYEGHGYGGGTGRFVARDVRRAAWWSLLGGASAGIGYGAHGLWQWHREGGVFTNPGFSMEPFPWQSALHFRGADDVGLAGVLLDRHGLYRLAAHQDLLKDSSGGVRAAASDDEKVLAVYLPFAKAVDLARRLDSYRMYAWDLEARCAIQPRLIEVEAGTRIEQPDVIGDVVVIFER